MKYKVLRFFLQNRYIVSIVYIALLLLLIPVLYWASQTNPTVGMAVFGVLLALTVLLSLHLTIIYPEFNNGQL